MLAEEIAGVDVALSPGFFRALGKLPVVEARAKTAGDRLRLFGTFVVAQTVVGEAQGLREHPAFAVVLRQESCDALLLVTADGFDFILQVVERD